jgi:hypothetical protein
MSNVTDARQRLATKAVRADGGQIFKSLKFGSSKAFAQDWQVFFLE